MNGELRREPPRDERFSPRTPYLRRSQLRIVLACGVHTKGGKQ